MRKNAFCFLARGLCLFWLCALLAGTWLAARAHAAEDNATGTEDGAEIFPARNEPPGRQGMDARGRPQWLKMAPGLEFGEFRLNEDESKLSVLRINPEKFDFILGSAGIDGKGPRPLAQWGKDHDLVGAINASMYLPDNNTSTGYMRFGDHVNNPRIVQRFGAFFVAGPKKPGLPRATILDRDTPDWRQMLDNYRLVIQNYRMINDQRRILWAPGGPLYSISAVALDGSGNILFLHSRVPVEAYSFAQQLLHLPLDIRTVMYVEGGAQAGMLVRTAHVKRELSAPHAPSLLVTGNVKAALPNILGVKARGTGPEGEADADMANGPQEARPPAEGAAPTGADELKASGIH